MTEKFKPTPEAITLKIMSLRCSESVFDEIEKAAKKFGVSKQAFCRQAILFALEHMDEPS